MSIFEIIKPNLKALKKSTSWEITQQFCRVLEVITSVITAPYPFYLLFVPRVTSNEREVMIGKVAVPKQISVLHRKNSCKISKRLFEVRIFCASAPGCYLTFVSSTLFDLSNRRSSKKFIFTCWSVLTDFCHFLHLLLVGSFLSSFGELSFLREVLQQLVF